MNSNPSFDWNTNGTMVNATDVDFLTLLLHELGHHWTLAHPQTTTSPVMYFNWTKKQVLTEDDKRGATQFYGPNTGWETALALPWFPGYTYGEALGNENVVLYQYQVSSAQLTPRPAELGVTPYSGSRHLKIYGIATDVYSYAYMRLFRADQDELGSNVRHFTIVNGTQLSWYQYNSAQKTMSVDIIFSDGSTLRNSGLTDQNGVSVHPASRNYPTGGWHFVSVNLSSLAGKRVQDIVVAYDNGSNNVTGTYRAYFDKVEIN